LAALLLHCRFVRSRGGTGNSNSNSNSLQLVELGGSSLRQMNRVMNPSSTGARRLSGSQDVAEREEQGEGDEEKDEEEPFLAADD